MITECVSICQVLFCHVRYSTENRYDMYHIVYYDLSIKRKKELRNGQQQINA